jgi:hypothetical protein
MPRDGGFHPFKGRVSRHFGDSVGCSLVCGGGSDVEGRERYGGKKEIWLTRE